MLLLLHAGGGGRKERRKQGEASSREVSAGVGKSGTATAPFPWRMECIDLLTSGK